MAVVLKTEEEQVERAAPWMPVPVSTEAAEAMSSAPSVPSAQNVSVALTPSTPLTSSASSTRRYDQATIEKALALASAMQQEHEATLTAEQVVRLGEEMNVEQTFVLKALSRLSAEEQSAAKVAAEKRVQVPQTVSTPFRALPRTDTAAAAIIPLAFSVLSFFVFREMTYDNWFSPFFLCVGAPLLAIFLGVRSRSKRLGFSSGALLGFLMAVAMWLTIDYPPGGTDVLRILGWTLAFSAAGAMLGTLSAIVTLHGAQMYRRSAAALARYFPGLAETDMERD